MFQHEKKQDHDGHTICLFLLTLRYGPVETIKDDSLLRNQSRAASDLPLPTVEGLNTASNRITEARNVSRSLSTNDCNKPETHQTAHAARDVSRKILRPVVSSEAALSPDQGAFLRATRLIV